MSGYLHSGMHEEDYLDREALNLARQIIIRRWRYNDETSWQADQLLKALMGRIEEEAEPT